jgi:hypothetical protein
MSDADPSPDRYGSAAGSAPPDAALEYARRLYDDVLGWYHSADTKAQVLLGLDGAFLAFLAAASFQEPDAARALLRAIPAWTWGLLAVMSVTLLMSMAAAIYCLWSRIRFTAPPEARAGHGGAAPGRRDAYPPGSMWFFQHVAALESGRFRRTLDEVDGRFELLAMASQIEILSRNVRRKHVAVDVGFALALATLLLFAMAAVTYVLRFLGAA